MLRRLPTLRDVAETAAFLASDRAGAMTAADLWCRCGCVRWTDVTIGIMVVLIALVSHFYVSPVTRQKATV